MTSFAEHLDAYLRLRRALGFKLVEHERLLPGFVAHLDATGAEVITTELAVAWASARDLAAGSSVPGMRLLVVRAFALRLSGLLCVRPGRLLSCQSGSRSPKWILRPRSALVQL